MVDKRSEVESDFWDGEEQKRLLRLGFLGSGCRRRGRGRGIGAGVDVRSRGP